MKWNLDPLRMGVFLILMIPLISMADADTNRSGSVKNSDRKAAKLYNPMSVSYLRKHLARRSPKLILTPAIERNLRKKLKTDPLIQGYYQNLKEEANRILSEPLLTRKLIGRRLLATSREMVDRMGILCMVYRIDPNPEILKRIDDELKAVCHFSDWHPAHFLDVAELSFAVALAVDWTGDALPEETVALAKRSLIEKGILPSYVKDRNGNELGWIHGNNNWNEVCHGGMIAASLAIADKDPELAAKTISRALDKLPNSLKEYGPDGIYPEGPTYWVYGTMYAALASSMLTTALGTDFGISEYPAFRKSANFYLMSIAPSGYFFNYSDCGDKPNGSGYILLSRFADITGDGLYLNKTFFAHPSNPGRFAGPGLVWLSEFKERKTSRLPLNWYGVGLNPVVFFRSKADDPSHFYFAAKGGSASNHHANMDAGTFVFELNGVRWVVDPGNQSYNELEQAGFDLWDGCQTCQRWTLLTKSNKGHSTLTVDDARHNVKGYAPITDFKDGVQPEVTIDLSEIFTGHLKNAFRKFVKENDHSLLTEDRFVTLDSTKNITWAIMTTADVIPEKSGALLMQNGEKLKLTILSPSNVHVSIISLDPPPLRLDKRIENLKRVEIRCPAYIFPHGKGLIQVRMEAPE